MSAQVMSSSPSTDPPRFLPLLVPDGEGYGVINQPSLPPDGNILANIIVVRDLQSLVRVLIAAASEGAWQLSFNGHVRYVLRWFPVDDHERYERLKICGIGITADETSGHP